MTTLHAFSCAGLAAVLLAGAMQSSRAFERGADATPLANAKGLAQPASVPLAEQATIRRDAYGVPHIIGPTEEAVAFAHGYAVAEDHLAALARLFLRARGELAVMCGERCARDDQLMRQLGIFETAERRFPELPPLMQGILEAYAGGYNLYLSRHRDQAPSWAKPITGVDVLAHCRAVLLADFALDLQPWRTPAPTPTAAAPSGSNMWAIGRGRSHSGRGILLANPHLGWQGSHLFHEVQLTVPGRINVSGATLIGFPVITIGFNETLGWSHSVNMLDADDVYELTVVDGDRYVYEGRELPFIHRKVTLQVKQENGVAEKTFDVTSSHHGPILRREGNKAYAYKSANLDLVGFLTQYNAMAKARSLAEFRAALQMQQLPMFNVAYADREGNVLYVFNGRIPIRPPGFSWAGIVPGDRSVTEWFAVHPLEALPQRLNPRGGYVQNSNDAPWFTTLRDPIDPKPFADYIPMGDGLGWRSQRGLQMLEANVDVTLDEVLADKSSTRLVLADRLKPDLLALIKTVKAPDPLLTEAAAVLRRWNNEATAESEGASLFLTWWYAYSGKARPPFKVAWQTQRPLDTPSGIGSPDVAMQTLKEVAAAMKQQHGTLAISWGTTHRFRRGAIDLPIGGADMSFRSIGYRPDKSGAWIAAMGDSYVLAVEFLDVPKAFSVLAYSESSNPKSPHYADQSQLFAADRYKSVWFTEPDIARETKRAYRPGQ